MARSLREQYDEFRAANGIRDNRPGKILDEGAISKRSKPQDSRFDFEAEGHNLDLRLSSFPTIFGDVVAIRILDRSRSLFKLEDLGFPPTVLKSFEALIAG